MRPGEVRWVSLPPAYGHEQAGRRPAIVLQDDRYAESSPLVLVAPLSSILTTTRFPGTLLLRPSAENGLRVESVILVFQTRAVDRRLVGPSLGSVPSETVDQIHALLDRLLGRR